MAKHFIEIQLEAVFAEVQELERLLKPYEKTIDKVSACPFAQMSVTEKINIAKLLLLLVSTKDKD